MVDTICLLDEVVITDALDQRPARAPDYRAESVALAALGAALADHPATLLQKLTDTMLELGVADSAGISLHDERTAPDLIQWVALSGDWAHRKGSSMRLEPGSCGITVARDAVQLMAHPERAFPEARFEPPVEEALLVPFHVEGRPIGTLWALAQTPDRRFDAEDVRLLSSLARFASAGYRMNRQLTDAGADVDDLGRLREHERVLLFELQHRVRNTLAVIRSIARRTAENSETVEQFRDHFDGRLGAFARTQSYVTRDPNRGIDLETIFAEELLAHQAREGEEVSLAGPEVRLDPKLADTLGLAIHELVTNAVKYGGLAAENGRVDVSWNVDHATAPPLLRIDWREHLPDGRLTPPERTGFGTELLQRTLDYELGATTTLDFTPNGLQCSIAFPLRRSSEAR